MRILKKIVSFIIILAIIPTYNLKTALYANAQVIPKKPVKVATLLFAFDDPYISLVRNSLEEIQNKNKDSVSFTFLDGRRNQGIQNALLDSALQSDYDLLLINLVSLDKNTVESVIRKAKQRNIPVILFNTVPFDTEPINLIIELLLYQQMLINLAFYKEIYLLKNGTPIKKLWIEMVITYYNILC